MNDKSEKESGLINNTINRKKTCDTSLLQSRPTSPPPPKKRGRCAKKPKEKKQEEDFSVWLAIMLGLWS